MRAEIRTTATNRGATADPVNQVGAAARWSVVPDASKASFSVRDKLVTTVHGSLPIEEGEVIIADGGDVTEAWVSFAVPGIASGNDHRDRDLQKPRFLDATTWPSIRVETLTATMTPTAGTARAVVLARGHRAPVDLSVDVIAATAGASNDEVRIRVTGRLDRNPLGIGVPTFVIGRFLDLKAELTLRRYPAGDSPGAEEVLP